MSFKPVRSFLADRLIEVDRDFVSHDRAFEDDSIGSNNFDKRFHIFYGDISTTSANQNVTQDVVNATVLLYFDGFRNTTQALDDSLDLANQYRINCLRRNKYANLLFIKNVVCKSIKARPLNTNANGIQVELQFSISTIFGTGVNLEA